MYILAVFLVLILSQHSGTLQGSAVCFSWSVSLSVVGIILTRLANQNGGWSSDFLCSLVYTVTHCFLSSTSVYHCHHVVLKTGKACFSVMGKSVYLLVIQYSKLWEYIYVWQYTAQYWPRLSWMRFIYIYKTECRMWVGVTVPAWYWLSWHSDF